MSQLEHRQAGLTFIPLAHCYRRLHRSIFVPAKDFFMTDSFPSSEELLQASGIWVTPIRASSLFDHLSTPAIDSELVDSRCKPPHYQRGLNEDHGFDLIKPTTPRTALHLRGRFREQTLPTSA
jgi:hypothetical protein